MAYRVKKAFQKMPQLTAVIDGKRIALNEAYTYTTKATVKSPPKSVNVPLATQAQLKVIFERGDPCIEQYEEVKAPEPRNFVNEHVPENPFEGVPDELIKEAQNAGKKKTVKHEP